MSEANGGQGGPAAPRRLTTGNVRRNWYDWLYFTHGARRLRRRMQSSVPGMAMQASPSAMTSHAERGMRLAELILAEALRAGLEPGSRLPTERKLSVDLGVTRSSVRHALDILQAQGRISREVGRGTFLLDGPPRRHAGTPTGPVRTEDEDRPAVAAAADFAPADVMA